MRALILIMMRMLDSWRENLRRWRFGARQQSTSGKSASEALSMRRSWMRRTLGARDGSFSGVVTSAPERWRSVRAGNSTGRAIDGVTER